MMHNAPLARLSALGLVAMASLTACSGGGGSGGGRMYVTSCVLGCNNGAGGQDVSCGIVGTYVNQDLAFQFSEPVDLAHVQANPTSFRVIEESTAGSPPGKFLLDPGDKRRLIWRPQLAFDPDGTPTFGFVQNGVYRIEIDGTSTGGAGPFVQSTDGRENESRVRCTINTTLGINDPIPGPPKVSVYVDELDLVNGGTVKKEISQVTGQVSTTSQITLVFDDLMNVGTVVTPSTLQAPFITVNADLDGQNLSDPTGQIPVVGTWTFSYDENQLTTTAIFTPTGGLPSGGAGERKIVVTIPPQVVDLVGNSVSNGGIKFFTPEILIFSTVTIPPGGEQFIDQSALDPRGSGADWGQSNPGRLLPGQGGGSGRLGSLFVRSGDTVVLNTSPTQAELRIEFTSPITQGSSTLVIGDPLLPTIFTFKNAMQVAGPLDILRRNTFTTHALAETVLHLNNFVADPAFPEQAVIEQATYSADGNYLVVTWDTPGTVGNGAFFFDTGLSAGGYYNPANPTLSSGGVDGIISFGGPGDLGDGQLLTNFDFQANPGGTPPPFTVDDGIFEFAEILIEDNGTLIFEGLEPGRLFARGRFEIESQGLIHAAGESPADHKSNHPLGQPGARGGPAAGDGGAGADRPDNTDATPSSLTTLSPIEDAGIENPGSTSLMGRPGEGVGDVPPGGGGTNPQSGAGLGGVQFPLVFPPTIDNSGGGNGLEMVDNIVNCACQQVAGPGSGGAYAKDGEDGVPVPITLNPLPDMGNLEENRPANDTAGGSRAQAGVPAPGGALGSRDLDPASGNLRGGSGGGGGGASVEETETTALVLPPLMKSDCITLPPVTPSPTPITRYRSHSGGGGGGGGGALQIQAGGELALNGVIDVGGGDGGSADTSASPVGSTRATPGGGGSGGAVLLQASFINVSPVDDRVVVAGGAGGVLHDTSLGIDLSVGGDGSPGIVRAESTIANPSFFDEMAGAIDPYDDVNVPDQMDPNDPNAAINWLSVDTWDAEDERPGTFSAGQSCWYKPPGSYLFLDFLDDATGIGWDMDLILDNGGGPQVVSYRTNTTFFAGNTPEEHWGALFSENGSVGAPVVVRFQGAQTVAPLTDPCGVDLFGSNPPIDPTSLTEWVMHPDELDAFPDPSDTVRFLVLFDAKHPDFGMIQGVTNLQIMADPK